jgi:AraC-like DNA-binding protein
MGIAIDRGTLDSWRPGGSEQMRAMAEAYLVQHTMPRETQLIQSVATMARSLLRGGEFTPEQTAKTLGLHARTLQRRLREEGSSFEKIKDDARREWATSLLEQPSVSLTQIAEMLGYADLSAFSRRCRRWFGEAPRAYRMRLVSKRPPRPGLRASRVNSLEANLRARRRADV